MTSTVTATAKAGTPLQHGYCFWYMRRGKHANSNTTTTNNGGGGDSSSSPNEGVVASSPTNTHNNNVDGSIEDTSASSKQQSHASTVPNPYENSVKTVATVRTVETFWRTYDHLVRPNDLPNTTDYHFFREGIKPTWEDPGNVQGGKWIVRLRKGLASRYWEETLLAMIGGQLHGVPDGEVCGAVVSIRHVEDIVSVWNRRSADRETNERLRDAIKKTLQLPNSVHMEYKPHQASLQDKSSFRNTTVWKAKTGGGMGEHRGGGGVGVGGGDRRGGATDRDRDRDDGPRRSGSWGDRSDKPKRDIERSWR